jgi:hypothetical protein
VEIGYLNKHYPHAVRRWLESLVKRLEVLKEVKTLLAELPPQGSKSLFELWKRISERRTGQEGLRSPLEQLRNLLIRLSEHWASFRVFDWEKDVPWTNNGTEQVIGRMKMRTRIVRGYKTESGMLAGLMLAGSRPGLDAGLVPRRECACMNLPNSPTAEVTNTMLGNSCNPHLILI